MPTAGQGNMKDSRRSCRSAWKPDFGPASSTNGQGALLLEPRDFLVAYNINLNTTSTRRANAIAYDVREKGRPKREGDS